MRTRPEEFERLPLRAHALLAGVPLHDVWRVDLPGGGPGRSVLDLRAALASVDLQRASPAAAMLFSLRRGLGRLLGWDRNAERIAPESFLHRLTDEDRRSSRVPPGTLEGPFRVLYVTPREAIAEIRNATVHAFSVFALRETGPDYALYWAIYVRPVGRITAAYMGLIDPFRRRVVYPAVLRRIHRAWEAHVAAGSPPVRV